MNSLSGPGAGLPVQRGPLGNQSGMASLATLVRFVLTRLENLTVSYDNFVGDVGLQQATSIFQDALRSIASAATAAKPWARRIMALVIGFTCISCTLFLVSQVLGIISNKNKLKKNKIQYENAKAISSILKTLKDMSSEDVQINTFKDIFKLFSKI
ncbi:MAG: hypothetical protein KAH32_05910 [Chlamydiia bacterium]|nr:hypothetical protein [Chlamydiia bacterium]